MVTKTEELLALRKVFLNKAAETVKNPANQAALRFELAKSDWNGVSKVKSEGEVLNNVLGLIIDREDRESLYKTLVSDCCFKIRCPELKKIVDAHGISSI